MLDIALRCRTFSAPPCAAVSQQPALPQSPGRCMRHNASGPGAGAIAEYEHPASYIAITCQHNIVDAHLGSETAPASADACCGMSIYILGLNWLAWCSLG